MRHEMYEHDHIVLIIVADLWFINISHINETTEISEYDDKICARFSVFIDTKVNLYSLCLSSTLTSCDKKSY